ncbi:MAG: OmpA family protein [Comamonadaceae bacterium]|nr:OmpA family protein [Comamonadaceae bacterium]
MNQNRKFFRLPLIALLAGLGVAQAGDVVIYREGETPDPSDIARILRGGAGARSDSDDGGSAPVRTRGIKLLSEDTQAKVAPARDVERVVAATAPARTQEATSFALQVQFPFNSAQVQPEMYEALDAVGEGIRLAGSQTRIVVEGHTDGMGAADYNLLLSRRRAEAVKNYLVSRHGVPAANLKVVGKGKFEPLIRDNPLAPENRRVQFRPGA